MLKLNHQHDYGSLAHTLVSCQPEITGMLVRSSESQFVRQLWELTCIDVQINPEDVKCLSPKRDFADS